METTYCYRIYPNKKQIELIQKTFGCCRFVYNYFLNRRINAYQENNETIGYYQCCKELTILKQEYEWLKEPDKCALQNSLKFLDWAYQNYWKLHYGFPKFKSKKNNYKSYRTQFMNTTTGGNIKVLHKYIQLPKLGYVKTLDKRLPKGRILNATISQERSGHYYVVICCTDVNFEQLPKTHKNIGIDLGIINFATLSNGIKIDNPRFYEKSEKRVIKLQKELSRKTIGSSNYNKARIKVAKLYQHITSQRKDFLHKLTHELVTNYDTICIEDLDVSEMKESHSKAKNKHVGDVSFYEFRRQLEYKCDWYGKELRIIDRYYPSSQICHKCGNRDGKKSLDIRKWTCPNCNMELDRDINAAINILNAGLI